MHQRLIITVDVIDGETTGLLAEVQAPAPGSLGLPSGAPRGRSLRFPKAHALRAVVAQLITTARMETITCTR